MSESEEREKSRGEQIAEMLGVETEDVMHAVGLLMRKEILLIELSAVADVEQHELLQWMHGRASDLHQRDDARRQFQLKSDELMRERRRADGLKTELDMLKVRHERTERTFDIAVRCIHRGE